MSSSNRSMVIRQDGTLWAWGDNGFGALGLGTGSGTVTVPTQVGTDINWARVSGGLNHTVAIKSDGSLWSWGRNSVGQLGRGAGLPDTYTPTRVGTDVDWKEVSCCEDSVLALKQDGSLWAWGDNYYGQLGLGDTTHRYTPTRVGIDTDWRLVAAGNMHVAAIKVDGSLWAWGDNRNGGLGVGDTTDRSTPTRVGSDTDWKQVNCGNRFTVAIKNDGSLWAWGVNNAGQLGLGDTTDRSVPTRVGTDTDWKYVDCGGAFVVAIKNDGSLWAWGANNGGQLGLGDTTNRLVPTRVGSDTDWERVVAGPAYCLAIKSDGTLWAWGNNYYGQLGTNDTTNRSSPVQITFDNPRLLINTSDPFLGVLLKYLFQDGNQIKRWDSSTSGWVVVGQAPVTEAMFDSSGMTSLAALGSAAYSLLENSTFSLLIWSKDPQIVPTVAMRAVPTRRIVFPNNDIDISSVGGINSVSLTAVQQGAGIVRVIVSVDSGITWKTWDSTTQSWVAIDPSDLNAVKNFGMTPTVVNERTRSDWDSLVAGSRNIRFAFYLEQSSSADEASADELVANVDIQGVWWSAIPGVDYLYGYPHQNVLRVKLLASGDYKINYPA